jgi:clan AA aspartic protease
MGTFSERVTLIHPDHRERSMTLDLLVDTGATYTLLPLDVVAQLGLPILEAQPAELASGERVTVRVGEVRVRLGERERTTMFVEGPAGRHLLLGAFTLEAFGLAADPVHQRLFPVVATL